MKKFLDWLLAATAVGGVIYVACIYWEQLQKERGRYALLQGAHAEQSELLSSAAEALSRTRANLDMANDQADRLAEDLMAMNRQTTALEREIARLQPLRKVDKIVVHHTASSHGDVTAIDQWHRERGWNGIGYHYVVTNGVSHSGVPCEDGEIEFGRSEDVQGAHAKGRNACSVGVSLVGNDHFSQRQVASLTRLLAHLCRRHHVAAENVGWAIEPHHADCPGTGCPLAAIKADVIERVRGLNDREH